MKTATLILFIGIFIFGCFPNISNKDEKVINEFDSLFPEIISDSLLISISTFDRSNHSGKNISTDLLGVLNINPELTVALAKIYFNDKKDLLGYLLANKDRSNIYLYSLY